MTSVRLRNTWNTLLLLLVLWSGVVVAVVKVADLHAPQENRKEESESQSLDKTCMRTCGGKNFGIGKGTCNGNMTLNCERRLEPKKGVEMETHVILTCLGTFENSSTPSTDGIQTHLKCSKMINMTATVNTKIPNQNKQSKFIFEYNCTGSFSSVMNNDPQKDGRMGLEFFQNSVCNGTEITALKYSTPDDLLERLAATGGSFWKVQMGSCTEAARLLSLIDILGVFYSYVVIPGCEPEPSNVDNLYETETVPITLFCNGKRQSFTEKCKGLLLGMTEVHQGTVTKVHRGTVTCKCSGDWKPHPGGSYICLGNLSGEQVRLGKAGKYVRSTFCGGNNTFVPLHWKDEQGRHWSGSWNNCTETGVRATIYTPKDD